MNYAARLILRAGRAQAIAVVVLFAIICFNATLVLATPYFGGRIVQAIATRELQHVWIYTMWMVVAVIIGGLGNAAESYLATLISERIGKTLRSMIFSHLLRVRLAFVASRQPGELMNRVDNDIDLLLGSFVGAVEPAVSSVIGLVVMIVLMITMDWRLTVVAAITVPVWAVATIPAAGKLSDLRMQMLRAKDRVDTTSGESLNRYGIINIKTFRALPEFAARFDEAVSGLIRVRLAAAIYTRVFQSALSVLGAAGPAILLIGGAWLAMHGQTSIAALVTFLSLQGRLIAPITQLASLKLSLATSEKVAERIDEVLAEPEECGGTFDVPESGDVVVTAAEYVVDGQVVLPPTSCVIPLQRSIAILGASGAGKTTLLHLLARLHDPSGGSITIDGIRLEDISLERLRASVVLVPQQNYFFTDSIVNNLRLAHPSVSDEDIHAVLEETECTDFIKSSSRGWDSVIGTGPMKLSGGEMQRLALARALLARPRVLLLDEATSALDAETEDRVLSRLYARTDMTIVHVTHRPDRLPRVDATVYVSAPVPA